MFNKNVRELTKADLDRLIAEQAEEDQFLEFKADVPSDGKSRSSGWNPVKGLQSFGRDRLMEELAAFANAFGGEIVLGMSETSEKPHRAGKITPLPAVHDLADRLRDTIKDTIEPPILQSAVQVIATGDDEGVIVLGVAPSTRGPHRVKTTLKVPVRREKSCDSMSMSEIIERARGANRIPPQRERAIRAAVMLKTDIHRILARNGTA